MKRTFFCREPRKYLEERNVVLHPAVIEEFANQVRANLELLDARKAPVPELRPPWAGPDPTTMNVSAAAVSAAAAVVSAAAAVVTAVTAVAKDR